MVSLAPLLLLLTADPALVPLTSAEGMTRLARSTARADFPHLANEFEPQENKAFCGVATATIVLNALRDRQDKVEKPEDERFVPDSWHVTKLPGFDPLFHRYTQGDLFNADTDAVKRRDEILGAPRTAGAPRDGGLQLRQLGRLLEALQLKVLTRVVDEHADLAADKREIVENLGTEGDYVIVNYNRAALGQAGGGHISPLGAYDAASDSLLVLDVNPTNYPWTWVPASALFGAMGTKDTVENRGYLLIHEGR